MCGARKPWQSLEEPGDERRERNVVLGGPDSGLAVGSFVDGYGDSLYHDCGSFRAGITAIGLARGLAPSMIVRRGKEIICKSVVCDRFFCGWVKEGLGGLRKGWGAPFRGKV